MESDDSWRWMGGGAIRVSCPDCRFMLDIARRVIETRAFFFRRSTAASVLLYRQGGVAFAMSTLDFFQVGVSFFEDSAGNEYSRNKDNEPAKRRRSGERASQASGPTGTVGLYGQQVPHRRIGGNPSVHRIGNPSCGRCQRPAFNRPDGRIGPRRVDSPIAARPLGTRRKN